jgi:hypothetical protein
MKDRRWLVGAGSVALAAATLTVAAPAAATPLAATRSAAVDTASAHIATPAATGSRPHLTRPATAAIASTNGKVDALIYARGIVYVGGEFTRMRFGGHTYVRRRLAAIRRTTGGPTSFRPSVNGQVMSMALSPNKKVLYIGGRFSAVRGATRHDVAAFSVSTGRLLRFAPDVSGAVRTIAITKRGVFLGGTVDMVNGVKRTYAAEVTTHGRVTEWAPQLDGWVRAMLIAPDRKRIILGGGFHEVNGVPFQALASVGLLKGGNEPFVNGLIPTYTGGMYSEVTSLATNGSQVFAGAEGTGFHAFDGTLSFAPDTGQLIWRNTCLGATQAVLYLRGVLYKASHAHDCSSMGGFSQIAVHWQAHHLLAESSATGTLLPWGTSLDARPTPMPDTNGGVNNKLGPFALATDGRQLFVGGEFTYVNNRKQEGLARFNY